MREGGCLCGSVRYRLEGEPISAGTCHCRTCRKAASAPHLPFAEVAVDQFLVTRGKPAEFRSSAAVIRSFCGQCGSPLTYRTGEKPDRIDVMTCSLDQSETMPPAFHVWASHKLPWECIGDRLPAYETTRSAQSRWLARSSYEIVPFWRDAGPDRWFTRDEAFDAELRDRFAPAHRLAATGSPALGEATADALLALVLLLDQVPRNIYRGSALAYATDPLARCVARHAVGRRLDRLIEPELRPFLYMPFHHSEDRNDQARSLRLFAAHHREYPQTSWLRHARHHAGLIRRFGRFPHRNSMFGRKATRDEREYLDNGGFTG
jgi:uncharacterized protein (DUF924 family)